MELDNIKKRLSHILSILDGCGGMNEVPAIEYDLIMEELRAVYSELRFAEKNTVTVEPAAGPVHHEVEVQEAAAIVVTQPAQQEVQEPVQQEQPVAVQEEVPAQEPEAKPEAAEPAVREGGVQLLFGDDEFVESSRRRRMIVRSLYDDFPGESDTPASDIPQPRQPEPQTLPAEPADKVSAEAEPQASEEPAAEVPAAEEPEAEEPAAEEYFAAESEQEDILAAEDVLSDISILSELMEAPVEDLTFVRNDDMQAAVHDEPAEAVREEVATAVGEPQAQQAQPETAVGESVPEESVFEESVPEAVLGEVINSDVKTVADSIPAPSNRLSDVVLGSGFALAEAIGINDRFLLIRDLFDGDEMAYEHAISTFDSFDTLDDCMVYIVENYEWNPYSDGARLLIGLIERKYGNRS